MSFECRFCSNHCKIAQVSVNKKVVARWGGRCDRWDVTEHHNGRSKVSATSLPQRDLSRFAER